MKINISEIAPIVGFGTVLFFCIVFIRKKIKITRTLEIKLQQAQALQAAAKQYDEDQNKKALTQQ